MPRLKQIACTIDWAETNVPFSEYGTVYGDGVVETYIAVPAKPQPFTVHLKSHGHIAEGLATLIYIDGEYQCNRNRVNLKPFKKDQSKAETEVDFRLRQKEKTIGDGQFLGRDWRFDCHNVVPADQAPNDFDATHFDQLGTIEVIVLRCRARGPQCDDDATDSYTHDSVLSKIKDSGREGTLDESSAANKNQESHQPTVEDDVLGGGFFGGLGFDGAADTPDAPQRHHFGLDGEAPPNGYWTWTYQPPAPPSNFQPLQKRVHFDMGPPSSVAPQGSQSSQQQQPPPAQLGPPPQNQAGWSNPPQQQQPRPQPFPPPQGQPAWQDQQAGPQQIPQGGPGWGGPAPAQRNVSNETANTIPSSYFSQPQMQNQMPPQMQPQQSQQPFASQMPGQWAPPAVQQNPWQAQGWPTQGYGGGGNWSAYPPWPGPSPYASAPNYVPSPAMPQGGFVPQMQGPPQWQAQGPTPGWNMNTSPTGPPQPSGGWYGPQTGWGPQQNRGGDPAIDSNQPAGQWGPTNNQGGGWDASNTQGGNNWGGDGQQNNSGNGGWGAADPNTPQDQPGDNTGGGGDNSWGDANDPTPQSNNNWENNDNNNNQTKQTDTAWGAEQSNNTQNNDNNWASGNDNTNNAQATQWGGTGTYDAGAAGPAASGTRASRPLYGPYGAYYTTAPRSAALDSEAEAEEDPPYDVPETVATEKGTTHQVQPGKGYMYTHRRASPEYLDNIEDPYARFVFKYRTQEQIEREIGISLPGEPTGDEEKQEYQGKSQDELIELLLRAKIALGGKIPSPAPAPVGAEEKQHPEAFNQVPVPAPKYDYLKYQLPESRKASGNAGTGLGIAAPANDGWGGGQPENNNNNSGGGWDSGGGASGWDGAKNDAAAASGDNAANQQVPQPQGGGGGGGQGWDSVPMPMPQGQAPQGGTGGQGWDSQLVLPPQDQLPQRGGATGEQGWETQHPSNLTPAPPGGWTSGAAPTSGQGLVQHGGSGTWFQQPQTQSQTQARPQNDGWGASSGPDEATSKTANGWQSSSQQQQQQQNQNQNQNTNQNADGNAGGGGGLEGAAPASGSW